MEEDYQYKKVRVKLDSDDMARLIKGETLEGWKTSISK
jgi:hypothetical protein